MWEIIKSLFRYSFKNAVSLIMLTALLSVSSATFVSLMMLSDNLSRSYDILVKNGNLNNVVINELYSTTCYSDSSLSGEAAKKQNEIDFKNELADLIGADSFRDFNAIDFTGSTSGFAYKIIEDNPSYTIDKTVIYNGHNVLSQTFDFDQLIVDADWSKDELINKQARRLVAFLASKVKWTSNEDFSNDAKQYLAVTDETNERYDPKFWPLSTGGSLNKKNTLAGWLKVWFDKTDSNYTEPISKGYRLSFDISGTVPIVGRIDNLSSYTAVVPNYVLKKHNKEILPKNIFDKLNNFNKLPKLGNGVYDYDYSNFQKSYITQSEIEAFIKSVDDKYKIKVDNIEYIIVGEGISPSFMYPVYSYERQTPNINSEIPIYVNSSGFSMAFDSARSSPVESYIAVKIPTENLTNMVNEINLISKKYMSWPTNVNSTFLITDTSNMLSPVALRVSFLPNLVASQVAISNALIFFISILVAVVYIFSIKKYINDNRASLGALRANGIKKRWIVWCMPCLSIIPGLGGGIIGYLFGQFTQSLMLNIYSFYWTIPTALTAFNPLLFFGLTLIPFAVMSLIAIASTFVLLKGNTNKLLNESNRFRASYFSMIASSFFKKSSVLTKFRTSIAFSSIAKLLMISLMFTLLSVCVTTGVAITGKFDYVKEKTYDVKKYQYAIDLITPTIQGGHYFRQQEDFIARPVVGGNNEILNYNIGMSDTQYKSIRSQEGNLLYVVDGTDKNSYDRLTSNNSDGVIAQMLLNHDPSISDSEWQKNDFNYLKNRAQLPATVDVEVGLGSLKTNPWDIARNLAPINQVTMSNNKTKKLWREIITDTNIYFNESNLAINGLRQSDKSKMINKPLNEIVGKNGFGYVTQYYPFNEVENKNESEPQEPNDNTVEFYDDNNKIIKQYTINKSEYNDTFKIKTPYILIMNTLMGLQGREYLFDTNNALANSYYEKVEAYRDAFFKAYYNYIPMQDDDETYTNVIGDLSFKNMNESVAFKGIKPDSQKVDLINKNNKKVNDLLKLETIKEDLYNSTNLHNIYDNPRLSDEANFKLIINESAAFQFGLKINDVVTFNPTNEATRFNNWKDDNLRAKYEIINNKSYKFKIVDIVSTYQNPEFYINQRVANYINGMNDASILQDCYYNKYEKTRVFDETSWFDYSTNYTIEQIDPFNGFYTSAVNPAVISSLVLYSECGLYPATDKFALGNFFTALINNVMQSTGVELNNTNKQCIYISKVQLAITLGFTNINELNEYYQTYGVDEIINELIGVYGQSPLLSTAYYIEPITSFISLFNDLSSFVNTIFIFVLLIVILISILCVLYLAIDFVYSSIGLCGMLKAFGFKDSTNVFSFMSMFFPSIIIATIASIPLSIVIMQLLKSFLFNFSGILLPLSYNWWYFFIGSAVLFAILAITILSAILILKKQQVTKLIARY